MSGAPKFCGNCGTPVTEQSARFCGECGAPLASNGEAPAKPVRRINPPPSERAQQPSEQSPPMTASHSGDGGGGMPEAKPESTMRDGVFSGNAIASAWQYAVIWAVGWLPIGILIADYYQAHRALNPEFYANYPLLWSYTLTGMVVIFGICSAGAGFLAGFSLYLFCNRKRTAPGPWAVLPVAAWAGMWGGSLWLMTIDPSIGDDILLLSMPVLGLVFGLLNSLLAAWIAGMRNDIAVAPKGKRLVAVSWSLIAVIGTAVALVVEI